MPPEGARRRRRKNLAPIIRTTFDGRRLLPQELPIVTPERLGQLKTDERAAVLAVCQDMLSAPAAPSGFGQSADRWAYVRRGDSGPAIVGPLAERVGGAVSPGPSRQGRRASAAPPAEPSETRLAPEVAPEAARVAEEEGWGDAEQMIEEWFRTGEFGAVGAEDVEEGGSWLVQLVRRVRRAWPKARPRAGAAWDAA